MNVGKRGTLHLNALRENVPTVMVMGTDTNNAQRKEEETSGNCDYMDML